VRVFFATRETMCPLGPPTTILARIIPRWFAAGKVTQSHLSGVPTQDTIARMQQKTTAHTDAYIDLVCSLYRTRKRGRRDRERRNGDYCDLGHQSRMLSDPLWCQRFPVPMPRKFAVLAVCVACPYPPRRCRPLG
jgi:hypothetical protein